MGRTRTAFDEVAELYDRGRPPYPQGLIADLADLTALDRGSRVLEVGCGTGLMTRAIAALGPRVTALELGPRLAAIARRNLEGFDAVEILQADFDGYTPPPEEFDVVLVATAFHWLDPATRAARCAAALRPGGMLAIVDTDWGVGPDHDPFTLQSQACYARWDPGHTPDYVLLRLADLPSRHIELEACASFDHVQLRRHCVAREYGVTEFRDLVETFSPMRALEPAARAGLVGCLTGLIETGFGGRVRRHDAYSLWVACRALRG